jgi:hypothetical protein
MSLADTRREADPGTEPEAVTVGRAARTGWYPFPR